MAHINIQLPDSSYEGTIIMNSTSSQFSVIRVNRNDADQYNTGYLEYPGIYLLLVDDDSVYVGESGLQSILTRIYSTHAGTIDKSWHTVVAFPFSGPSITKNELLFIENAMCEYVHKHFSTCLTTTPAPKNCNAAYRNSQYKLTGSAIKICNQYIAEIQHYLSLFPHTIFAQTTTSKSPVPAPKLSVQTDTFYYDNPKRDAHAKAIIEIHCGHTKKRKTILLKGSKISDQVSKAFTSHTSVSALRTKLEAAGKIANRVLQDDIEFDSQSGAGEFLNGTSFDGNTRWKTVKGDAPLKSLL